MPICRKSLKLFTTIKESYTHCVKTIITQKRSRKFYIGATAWPTYRVEDHKLEKKMSSMVLLCETPSLKISSLMEQKVIKRFIGKKYNMNVADGGEGLTNERNYIYVLFR